MKYICVICLLFVSICGDVINTNKTNVDFKSNENFSKTSIVILSVIGALVLILLIYLILLYFKRSDCDKYELYLWMIAMGHNHPQINDIS
jgi:hypothetical protein